MRRGEIWWTDFGRPIVSVPGYRRPVLVVQSDPFKRSRIATVIVVPFTRNLRLSAAPGNVACGKRQTGLPTRSEANVSQLTVLNRDRLVEKVGVLSATLLTRVEDGIRPLDL